MTRWVVGFPPGCRRTTSAVGCGPHVEAARRWLAPDSYMGSYDLTNPESLNRYTYALNNPTSSIDPVSYTHLDVYKRQPQR